jgi:Major Facilitator Superfamily
MTAGFALGPLLAGLLAQWAAAPRVVPYLPHLALMAVVLVLLRNTPETVSGGVRRAVRLTHPGVRSARFRKVVLPMAPWVFAAPAIAFALLPSIVGAGHATDGIALTATIAMLCALAGVLIQPLARRLDSHVLRSNHAATTGLVVLTAGLALSAVTAQDRQSWLLVPCSIVLGSAYGLCLVAGLVEIQRLADRRELAGLTAAYYAVAYLGFAAPYVFALAAHLASYSILLVMAAAITLSTAALVARQSARQPEPARSGTAA